MNVIKSGGQYDIYHNELEVFPDIPVQYYRVILTKTGFHLVKNFDVTITEGKVYGVHTRKIDKVMNSFKRIERNLGVILSGDKGIGKSLFAKMMAMKAVSEGYPVILVDTYYPGIASFLESINQEVVVIFDEFEKTFKKSGDNNPQDEMLTLFDGFSTGKKMFIVTCNSLYDLNDYLVNRPGRFLYHFRFDYPTAEEITQYLQDKLEESFWGEIDKVVVFSKKVKLNYDCLRAIAYELSFGESFEEAIADLNIVNTDVKYYDITVTLSDGTKFYKKEVRLDLFDKKIERYYFPYNEEDGVYVIFDPTKAVYSKGEDKLVIDPATVKLELDLGYHDEDDEAEKKRVEKVKADFANIECSKLVLTTSFRGDRLHYEV